MSADPTPARCLEVYREVWNDSDHSDDARDRELVKEMCGIAYAPNLDAAIAVIAWWWEGDRETEDGDRQRVTRARAMLRGEPSPEVQAELDKVVAFLRSDALIRRWNASVGGSRMVDVAADAIARGVHREP